MNFHIAANSEEYIQFLWRRPELAHGPQWHPMVHWALRSGITGGSKQLLPPMIINYITQKKAARKMEW